MLQQTTSNAISADHDEHLRRVVGKIALLVLEFVQTHNVFTGQELHDFVAEQTPVAPGSADRTLRSLRREGFVNYRIVNRRLSQYQVVS